MYPLASTIVDATRCTSIINPQWSMSKMIDLIFAVMAHHESTYQQAVDLLVVALEEIEE